MTALLKAGEFAQLCRTTKEALRHYDRIGLLCPAARGENGYKLYSRSSPHCKAPGFRLRK